MKSKVYKIQFLNSFGVIKEVLSTNEIEAIKSCTSLREIVQYLNDSVLFGYESCKIYDSDFLRCFRIIVR